MDKYKKIDLNHLTTNKSTPHKHNDNKNNKI